MIEERFDEERFEFGEAVRVTRNVRNDGTYPGMEIGDLLIRRGSVGNVIEVGTFLQDQVIYTVHFLNHGRMVGCRAEELISADAVWKPSRFEFRDKVKCTIDLGVQGNVIAAKGSDGEILKVLRETEPLQYHVRFPGRTLQVPESVLEPADPSKFREPEE
ncbi:nitrogen fixation protein NifZ [Methylomonas sp. MED-D]|uniref:Nitrogen fixation protein NifZ n=1 Tax=Methylomonas koyamae TaxID=702114 RepID=A0A177N7J5_9GAMM|nr:MULTISPECIES: nitrogen fixation protein NifZ [Methylomonas]NJA05633.1 nitrogen fixation protein NifZ [Methylococcaceae bacterium WWC4]MDT4330188.1 nitrogen fixation protein NifZ [Methylomonas sp. MV1]OAI13159.1 nitrogen fixation protein NifZ [Methylomonas koyamae]OHX38234.1 nitrogen fixation protein NifZ [Methylomonas sp. LWB]WGS86674.1 nitrogen fixation protein NifZ [Methylomonas sp. UP202]